MYMYRIITNGSRVARKSNINKRVCVSVRVFVLVKQSWQSVGLIKNPRNGPPVMWFAFVKRPDSQYGGSPKFQQNIPLCIYIYI